MRAHSNRLMHENAFLFCQSDSKPCSKKCVWRCTYHLYYAALAASHSNNYELPGLGGLRQPFDHGLDPAAEKSKATAHNSISAVNRFDTAGRWACLTWMFVSDLHSSPSVFPGWTCRPWHEVIFWDAQLFASSQMVHSLVAGGTCRAGEDDIVGGCSPGVSPLKHNTYDLKNN